MEILELEGKPDIKMYLTYDENCVSQVLRELPPLSLIRQACYIFFENKTKRKIKDESLYFLALLSATDQVNVALKNSIPQGYVGKYFVVKCCKNDVYETIQVSSREERILLSRNSILSM